MNIHPLPVLKDNYVWIIIDNSKQTALVVDPGEATPVIDFLEQNKLTLKGILITHHHWDHTNGITALKKAFPVPVAGPANENIPGMTLPQHADDHLQIEDFPLTLHIIAIPGHTLGHIAYYAPGMLFCGDTLFASGCGRVFEGTPAQMFASLQKIAALPDATIIYCAHEYTLNNLRFAELVEPTNTKIAERIKIITALRHQNLPSLPSTLHEEKETNPFLRCDSRAVIASAENYAGQRLDNPADVFSWLRKWKDTF